MYRRSGDHFCRKDLDTVAIDTLYKTARAMDHSRTVRKKPNDEDNDIQTTFDEMAAARRHVFGRLFVRPDLVRDQYFWR
jgi:hypothetical protein